MYIDTKYNYVYIDTKHVPYIYTETCLYRSTCNGPFREVIGVGIENKIELQWYFTGDRLGPK